MPRAILDLGLTLEYLETHGVPVIGYQHRGAARLLHHASPASSVDYRLDTPEELAEAFARQAWSWACAGGMLVTNPIPEEYSMDPDVINKRHIDEAVAEAKAQGIHGKDTTPFLLAKIQGAHRRRQPGGQYPAGLQQRPCWPPPPQWSSASCDNAD